MSDVKFCCPIKEQHWVTPSATTPPKRYSSSPLGGRLCADTQPSLWHIILLWDHLNYCLLLLLPIINKCTSYTTGGLHEKKKKYSAPILLLLNLDPEVTLFWANELRGLRFSFNAWEVYAIIHQNRNIKTEGFKNNTPEMFYHVSICFTIRVGFIYPLANIALLNLSLSLLHGLALLLHIHAELWMLAVVCFNFSSVLIIISNTNNTANASEQI